MPPFLYLRNGSKQRAFCFRFRILGLLILLFLSSSSGMAYNAELWGGLFVSRDHLRWRIPIDPSIPFPEGADFILSELKWSPLVSTGFEGGISLTALHPRLFLRAQGQAGYYYHGRVRDSDWSAPAFMLEYSRSISDSKGWSALGQVMGGVRFPLGAFSIDPLVGLDGAVIHLNQENLRQIFFLDTEDLSFFQSPGKACDLLTGTIEATLCPTEFNCSGQVSLYDVQWLGPLIGAEITSIPCAPFYLELLGWWSVGHYQAHADWVLREVYQHPTSFVHHASLHTWNLQGALRWQLTSGLGLRLEGGGRQTWAKEGNESIYLQEQDMISSRVQDIDWKRWWVSLAVSFLF